jgi:hypothetical protein
MNVRFSFGLFLEAFFLTNLEVIFNLPFRYCFFLKAGVMMEIIIIVKSGKYYG